MINGLSSFSFRGTTLFVVELILIGFGSVKEYLYGIYEVIGCSKRFSAPRDDWSGNNQNNGRQLLLLLFAVTKTKNRLTWSWGGIQRRGEKEREGAKHQSCWVA